MNIWKYNIINSLGIFLTINTPSLGNGFLGPYNSFSNAGVGGAGIAGGSISDVYQNRTITDASSLNLNPALAAEVPNQGTFSAGLDYQNQRFDPSKSSINHILTTQGGPVLPPHRHSLKNKNQFFPSSFGGLTHRINDQVVTGATVTGFSWGGGGGFVRYRSNIISPALPPISKSFNLAALTIPLTIAFQPTPCQSYGFSMILAAAGLQTNVAKPTNPFIETSGHNHLRIAEGLGARVGSKWDLFSQLSAGATISTPVYFTKFDSYTDVLPHRLEIPMQIGGGLTWHALSTTDVLIDITGYFWKLSKSTNKSPVHGGFGWRNTFDVRTGINHKINDIWTVRLGYQYSMTPVQKKFLFNQALSPSHVFIKNYITTGLKVDITPCLSLEGELAYGLKTKLRDPGAGPFNGFTRNITMEASCLFSLFGFTWKY